MTPQLRFFVGIALSFFAWGMVAARYIWPELRLLWVSNWQFSRSFSDWATLRGARRLTYAERDRTEQRRGSASSTPWLLRRWRCVLARALR